MSPLTRWPSKEKGKIYFNLGAAHADNPEGDLVKAGAAYAKALQCYTAAHVADDLIRTSIRLGKVYLLQKSYDLMEKVINEKMLSENWEEGP